VKRIYLIALLLLTISSPLVFSQKRPKTKSKTPTQPVKPLKTPQVDEGYNQAVKIWSEYLRRCGNSYYMRTPGICEYRSVSIFNQERPLSEADKLNGIERALVSNVEAKARRCQKSDGAWGAWETGPYLVAGLMKKSGIWTVTHTPSYNHVFLIKGQIFDSYPGAELNKTNVSCSDITGLSPAQSSKANPINRSSFEEIALDNMTAKGFIEGTSVSLNLHINPSGSNRMLWVIAENNSSIDDLIAITVNDHPMSQIFKYHYGLRNQEYLYIYALPNPPTGNVTIRAESSSLEQWALFAASYTGVKQSIEPDNIATNIGESVTPSVSITTSTDNCWVLSHARGYGGGEAIGGNLVSNVPRIDGGVIGNSVSSIHPAGTFTATFSSISDSWHTVAIAFAPANTRK
jgi:hypothetical protein